MAMTQDEAMVLCAELEQLVARAHYGRSALQRVREIESSFFADLAADGRLLTVLTQVVDGLEEALCDARGSKAVAREFLLQGPVHEELERLKVAISVCYGAAREPRRPWLVGAPRVASL